MQISTLYQLLAMRLADSPLLAEATHFLMIPDLFHWLLTGVKANEFTIATHDAVFRSAQERVGDVAARAARHPDAMLGDIVQPGAKLGPSDRAGRDGHASGDVEVVRARHARHGKRRDGGARRRARRACSPTGATSARARGRSWAWKSRGRSSTTSAWR